MDATRLSAAARSRASVGLLIATLVAGCGSSGTSTPPARTKAAAAASAATLAANTRTATDQLLSLPAVLPNRSLRVPILMYHRIDALTANLPLITRGLTVTPADFASQVQWLRSHHYHAITQLALFNALEHGASLPTRPLLITFDDGYDDILQAARILHRVGYPATAYLITDRLSAVPGFLTWPHVSALQALGVEIGSHTVSHRALTTLSDHDAAVQMIRSRGILQRRLHHPVQWFAYPAGNYDQRIVAIARKAGYVLAVTTNPGVTQDAQQPLTLDRLRVLDTQGPSLAGMLPS